MDIEDIKDALLNVEECIRRGPQPFRTLQTMQEYDIQFGSGTRLVAYFHEHLPGGGLLFATESQTYIVNPATVLYISNGSA